MTCILDVILYILFLEDSMSGQSPARPDSDGITPLQQMLASCSGAFLTSLLGKTHRLFRIEQHLEPALNAVT